MVCGVLVGLLGLGEALPHTAAAAATRLASWACILLGVTGKWVGGGGGLGGWPCLRLSPVLCFPPPP